MRAVGAALELRVELDADEPLLLRLLHNLHEPAIRGQACQTQARVHQLGTKLVVELIAVAVALGDLRCTVGRAGQRILRQHAGILAETHRAALGGDAHLIGHERDHGVLG